MRSYNRVLLLLLHALHCNDAKFQGRGEGEAGDGKGWEEKGVKSGNGWGKTLIPLQGNVLGKGLEWSDAEKRILT